MALTLEALETCLDRLREDLRGEPEVDLEFEGSRGEFQPEGSSGDALARRRHLEWFLLERPSDALEGVPVERMRLGDGLDAPPEELRRALLESYCGIFEVSSVRAGEGLWVRDLASVGEHPLEEPEGSLALQPGDLLVGRLFPLGDGLFRVSRAAGVFREPRLCQAVRRDLERTRGARRGVLRISQAELERMFFGGGERAGAEAARAEAREVLRRGGLEPSEIDAVLAELAAESFDPARVVVGGGDRLGEILDCLAFETGVDLEAARRALLAAWAALSAQRRAGQETSRAASCGRVRAAIEAFDRGRKEGRDLEGLFRDLERDLALDEEEEEQEEAPAAADEPAPDFPGVVGAMVEEYLWDQAREHGAERARAHGILRTFAQFARHVGVFENLSGRDLAAFATVWLPERGGLSSPADARAMVEALASFCRWSEEQQGVPLFTAWRASLEGIAESLPRLVEVNLHRLAGAEAGAGELFEVEAARPGEALLRPRSGEALVARLDPAAVRLLRPGDRLRGRPGANGGFDLYCAYPPQCAQLEAG